MNKNRIEEKEDLKRPKIVIKRNRIEDKSIKYNIKDDINSVTLSIKDNTIDLSSFNQSSKDSIIHFINDLINNEINNDNFNFLKLIFNSPYFHFVSQPLKKILLKIILHKHKLNREIKLITIDYLNKFYDPIENIRDFVEMYNFIDTMKIKEENGVMISLKNYLILVNIKRVIILDGNGLHNKIYGDHNKIYGDHISNEIYGDHIRLHGDHTSNESLQMNLIVIFNYLKNCIPFIEFLCKSNEISFCKYFLIFYCYSFLSTIKIDLLNIKSVIKEEIEENGIGKVFSNYEEIINTISLDVKDNMRGNRVNMGDNGDGRVNMGDNGDGRVDLGDNGDGRVNMGDNGGNKDPLGDNKDHIGDTIDNRYYGDNRGDTMDNRGDTIDNRNHIGDNGRHFTHNNNHHIDNNYLLNIIFHLFNSNNIDSILFSIYKRLFFFMLFKNKKIFQSIKIFNIFTKNEKSFIFKNIKNYKNSFVNIFKQIDQKYILKYCIKNEMDGLFFNNIKEEKLKEEDLRLFYALYFDYLEKTTNNEEIIKIKGIDIYLISKEFKNRIDKEVIKKVKIYKRIELKRVLDHIGDNRMNMGDNKTYGGDNKTYGGDNKTYGGDNKTYGDNRINGGDNRMNMGDNKTYRDNRINGGNGRDNKIYERDNRINGGDNKTHTNKIYTINDKIDVLSFISHLSLYSPNIIDNVELVSLIIDDPIFILKKTHVNFYNLLFEILLNCISNLNSILIKRMIPFLRRLVFYKEYSFNIGRIMNNIDENGFINEIGMKQDDFIRVSLNRMNKEEIMNIIDMKGNTVLKNPGSPLFNNNTVLKNPGSPLFNNNTESHSFHIIIIHSFYNPNNPSIFPILSKILSFKNSLSLKLLQIINMKTNDFNNFIILNISLLQSIYIQSDFSIILEIILKSLKFKSILPCMAIPYIFNGGNSFYILKNFKESCINCINDCIYILCERIKSKIRDDRGDNRDSDSNGDCNDIEDDRGGIDRGGIGRGGIDRGGIGRGGIDRGRDSDSNGNMVDTKFNVNYNTLNSIFSSVFSNNFIFIFSKSFSFKNIIQKIDYKNDILIVYAILRFLKDFNKKEKDLFFKHILENVSDEKIFEMVENAKEFYRKNNDGDFPIEFLFSN